MLDAFVPADLAHSASSSLDADRRAALAEVERFASRAAAHGAMGPGALGAHLVEARALGIVPEETPSGLGLWDDADHGDALHSIRLLDLLARANAGLALAAHLEALARWLARRLDIRPAGAGIVALHGRIGIGRGALARALAGAPLDPGDRALLGDVYAADAPRLVTAPFATRWWLTPVSDDEGALRWALFEGDTTGARLHPHAHGFDELATFSVRPGAARVADGDAASSVARMGGAFVRMSLGLVAIALGAARRGHALARSYAALREQGGARIERHAAVQLLLASSRQAIDAVDGQLESVARASSGAAALPRAIALRAEAHPLLCRGANDAMQVFGGIGYMRDTGAERVVRDLNHLRATCGAPPELSLFVAEWERLHA